MTLGAYYRRASEAGLIKPLSVPYYASGGYYVALTLYQLWPVTVEGKPFTLVWRGDMVSAPTLAHLHGVERLGSESVMMKQISKAVTLFRRDTGGAVKRVKSLAHRFCLQSVCAASSILFAPSICAGKQPRKPSATGSFRASICSGGDYVGSGDVERNAKKSVRDFDEHDSILQLVFTPRIKPGVLRLGLE